MTARILVKLFELSRPPCHRTTEWQAKAQAMTVLVALSWVGVKINGSICTKFSAQWLGHWGDGKRRLHHYLCWQGWGHTPVWIWQEIVGLFKSAVKDTWIKKQGEEVTTGTQRQVRLQEGRDPPTNLSFARACSYQCVHMVLWFCKLFQSEIFNPLLHKIYLFPLRLFLHHISPPVGWFWSILNLAKEVMSLGNVYIYLTKPSPFCGQLLWDLPCRKSIQNFGVFCDNSSMRTQSCKTMGYTSIGMWPMDPRHQKYAGSEGKRRNLKYTKLELVCGKFFQLTDV